MKDKKGRTLSINKPKSCKAKIRREMTFILEAMTELDKEIEVGRKAETRLMELEEEFNRLCKLVIKGEN